MNNPINDSLINSIQAAVIVHDAETRIVQFNKKALELLGLTEDQLFGKTAYDPDWKISDENGERLPPEMYPVNQVIATQQALHEFLLCIHRPDRDDVVWVNVSAEPVFDALGKIEHIVNTFMDVTSQIQAQEELKKSRKLFIDMLDAMPGMVWMKDPDGVYTACNRQLADLVNRPKEEITGATDYDVFPKEKADFYRQHDQKAIANRTATINEESADFLHKDYSLWIETIKTPMYDPEGKLVGVLGIGCDIAGNHATLKESRENQFFLNMLLENSHTAMLVCSPTGLLLKANQALYDSFNVTADEIIGKYNLFEDENLKREDIAEKLQKLRDSKRPARFDLPWTPSLMQHVQLPDANSMYVEVSIFPLLNQDNDITHIIVQCLDTSQRKEMEDRLRASERRFRALFEQAGDYCMVLDPTTPDGIPVIVDANDAACSLHGYTRENFIGRPVADIDDAEGRKLCREHTRQIMTGKPFHIENRHVRKDGSTFHVAVHANRIDIEGSPPLIFTTEYDITARIEAEEAKARLAEERGLALEELRENKHMLEQAERIAKAGSWEWDLATNRLLWSNSVFSIFGLQVQEPTYELFRSHLYPDDVILVEKHLNEMIEKSSRPFEFDYRIVRGDGNIAWIHHVAEVLRDNDGKPLKMIGLGQDITEQRKKQQELELLFESSPLGICTADSQGNILTTNPAYEQLLGYSKEELRGRSFFDFTHPDFHPKNKELFQTMSDQGSSEFSIEKKYIRRDGAEIYVEVHASAVVDERSETTLGTAFVKDITKRKQAETKLHQARELLDSIINGIAEPIFVKDEKYSITMVNDAWCKLVGRPKEDFLGKTAHDLFEKDEADVFWQRDSLVLNSNKPDVMEQKATINGETRILSTSKISFLNPVTGKRNIVGIIRDISENKAVEAQLHQAQKMESVGRLAGGVAHDFNNILSVIIGYSEFALESLETTNPLYEDITEILEAGKRSADITRQLLAFARKQTTAPRVLELNRSIEGLLKMLRRLLGENIDLAWMPGLNLWSVKIDPAQIDQVLANLCVNARDAITDVGKVTIETKNIHFDDDYCSRHAGVTPGDFVMLAVSDSGCGMDPEMIDNIFEPFFTTKAVYEGTGLGLSTVYGIIKQNNGFVNVYSEVGHGTTFRCYLPVYATEKIVNATKDEQAMPRGDGETILLVEDDPSIMKVCEVMLKKTGYKVLPTRSPNEALEFAKKKGQDIDLLLTDVIMPRMNGRELSLQMQKIVPGIKTLFMSGYTANVIAHRGVLDDGIFFIQKPLVKRELAVKIREVLEDESDSSI